MRRAGGIGPTIALAALVAIALACDAQPARASAELVKNGAFTAGEGDLPAQWSTESWIKDRPATRFSWTRGPEGIGVVTIDSSERNDGGFVQSVPVSPSTWYRVSGWVRTENVGEETLGAYLSVLDTFFNTEELRGTRPWQEVALWVKTGPIDTSLRIGARLGGYGSLNTGRAQFTMISVQAAGTPLAKMPFVYGGEPAEEGSSRLPWVYGVAVLVVAGVAFVIWRYFLPASPSART
jgi:hypothetical protein